MKEVVFSQSQLATFRRVSGDHNPLHWDKMYSRRSQFGEPVFYGIAALFICLAEIAAGKTIDVQRVRVSFKKPLFIGQSYRLKSISKGSHNFDLLISKGETACLTARVTLRSKGVTQKTPLLCLDDCEDTNTFRLKNVSYQIEDTTVDALKVFAKEFGISPTLLPKQQFAAFLWCSYFVGMQYPGKQALLSSVDIVFEDNLEDKMSLVLDAISCILDERFNHVTIQARGAGIAARLEALKRPQPIDYDISQVSEGVRNLPEFSGKRILVTGSSRGFGNVLAKAFLAKESTVFSVYSTFKEGAAQLEHDAKSTGGIVINYQADLTSLESCFHLSQEISREFGNLDILVNNAFPRIDSCPYLEQNEEAFLNYVIRAIRMCSQPTRAFLPLLARDGTVVNISTAWTSNPEVNFTHYLAAKGAIESLTRALSVEFPKLRFVLVRAPRMLTDQTNTVFQREVLVSATKVAADVLSVLAHFPKGRNYVEL